MTRLLQPLKTSRFTRILVAILALSPAVARGQEKTFVPGSQPGKQTPAQPSKETLKEEGKGLFGPGKAKPADPSQSSWSIVIVAFRGDEQDAGAQQALLKVQNEGGLKEAYQEKRGQATIIAFGRYDDPASKQARADLERVKNIEVVVNGQKQKPFEQAFLSPPADVPGTIPEYDLRNARKLGGDWVLYTLQIGVYGRGDQKPATPSDMAEFRKTAEKAVIQLRREGEQAYYSHGPTLSMVTVGLFGKDDFDPQAPGVESPTLRTLRQRYPYNLLNGMGVKHTVKVTDPRTGAQVKKEKIESSALVNVPRD